MSKGKKRDHNETASKLNTLHEHEKKVNWPLNWWTVRRIIIAELKGRKITNEEDCFCQSNRKIISWLATDDSIRTRSRKWKPIFIFNLWLWIRRWMIVDLVWSNRLAIDQSRPWEAQINW
jgi:hypothetical protein